MDAKTHTPAAIAYRMPAEWERHEATWLSWPRREGISFPGSFDRVMPALRDMVAALVESENVCINVCNGAHEAEARAILEDVDLTRVTFYRIATNEPWCRDHGPIFLTRGQNPSRFAPQPEKGIRHEGAPAPLAVVDWDYNAWGGKYPPCDLDEVVPTRVAETLKLAVFYPNMVLEGGAIDVNGSGALLTTESCLLNKNRNPNLSRGEIEQRLRDYLGVREILWLGHGIAGDDTDGHIDDIARFVSQTKVVAAVEENADDENYELLQENLRRLEEMKITVMEGHAPPIAPKSREAGLSPGGAAPSKRVQRKLDVVTMPMPRKIVRESLRLPASYANFYIANSCVLCPTFADPADEAALSILQECFPDRRLVGIDSRELIWGLGTFHCLTQQQPAA